MTTLTEAVLTVIGAKLYDHRTAVPGVVDQPQRRAEREQDVDFNPGIGDLVAQEANAAQVTASAPVLTIAGGGFYMLLPVAAGDEVVGLVSDRSLGIWRENRTPGSVDKMTGRRTGDLSDVMLAPFAFTAPDGAPETWDGMALGGPEGPAFELAASGSLTITKRGVAVATIEMDDAGSITLTPAEGQSVNVGGAGAVELAKFQELVTAIDAMMTALVAAGAGIAFAGATTAQEAWDLAKAAIATTIAKGI